MAWSPQDRPRFAASNIHRELSDKFRGLSAGKIGAMHLLARRTGLIEAIDKDLPLLKVHLPYHESDHVLNMAYNILCGGTCLQDLELLRNNESHLDALGAQRIPDPPTAGDFCRRFDDVDVELLQMAINDARVGVWKQQPAAFFEEAILDADGSLAWTLKAWFALLLPETGRWAEKPREQKQTVLRMEFKGFLNAFMRLPCQIVRTGRRIVYRLLSWNSWSEVFFRGVDALREDLKGLYLSRPASAAAPGG